MKSNKLLQNLSLQKVVAITGNSVAVAYISKADFPINSDKSLAIAKAFGVSESLLVKIFWTL